MGIDVEEADAPGSVGGQVKASYKEIFTTMSILGWTGFGGPAAHVGLFKKAFVERLNWMSETVFLELFALGQCLPGPTSTQLSFSVGITKKGIPGGLMSGMLFQYPGLLMMSLLGAFAKWALDDPADWVRGISAGLAAVGVALVAGAAKGLCEKICGTKPLAGLCVLSAVVAYLYRSAWIFPLLILVGGLVTLYLKRNDDVALKEVDESVDHYGVGPKGGAFLILLWAVLLVLFIVLRDNVDYYEADGSISAHAAVHWFEAFYRTGSIIFGGGQVVLPLLLHEVVSFNEVCTVNAEGNKVCEDVQDPTRSWVTEEEFFAGLGIVQAMPGPLFNLSAYLGAVMAIRAGHSAMEGIAACWLGLFGPGILLIYGVLPFWGRFRSLPVYRRMLPGLNASAVGLVVAAVFQMFVKVRSISEFPNASVAIGIIGYSAVEQYKLQAPLAVVGGGVLGLIAWALEFK